MENTFDSDLIYSIFKLAWSRKAAEKSEETELNETEVGRTSKKNWPTTANSNAQKVSSELLRIFVTEAVQRAAIITEAEGNHKIEATHLERILPQLLLDF
ncbi:centromere protein X isoform X4 [Phalaenopsis equestris]|uniref:centromere protein X isoform X4 n=1 Tax=Phalaenopsis equestris TaxID=78828 RepID=UPI0009E3652D|nr:centromere protein X isoform X4 [Phalaenopsis equestris]